MNRTDTQTPATEHGHGTDSTSIGGYAAFVAAIVAFIAAIVAFVVTVTWVCVSPVSVMLDGGETTPFLYGSVTTIGLSLLAIALSYLAIKLDTERIRTYDNV